MNQTLGFYLLTSAVILQRLAELVIAKRNTRRLLQQGAIERGAGHYWLLVTVHVVFFASLLVESAVRGIAAPSYWPGLLAIFLVAQVLRLWVIRTLKGRWTTRIIVIPKAELVRSGPFAFLRHPNYLIVALEIFVLPMMFGLTVTATVSSLFNAAVLLLVRIPEENRALSGETL